MMTGKLLKSRSNPDGLPLAELLKRVRMEMQEAFFGLADDPRPVAAERSALEKQAMGLLLQAEGIAERSQALDGFMQNRNVGRRPELVR
jgi:hypothetical protein